MPRTPILTRNTLMVKLARKAREGDQEIPPPQSPINLHKINKSNDFSTLELIKAIHLPEFILK